MQEPQARQPAQGWITRTIAGIVLATFFSDFSHEMITATLPAYLLSLGLGPAALGVIEGVADFLASLSKLAGGLAGQRLARKKPFVVLGYFVTAAATSSMALVGKLAPLAALRTLAWTGRGFRSPLRDFLLADEVERTHFGRAYGLERGGDMAGAVVGPVLAALLVWAGLPVRSVMLWALLPGLLAAGSVLVFVRERRPSPPVVPGGAVGASWTSLPRGFWLLLVGVSLFGLGDFSRTFLILIASRSLAPVDSGPSVVFLPVLLYAAHNLVSAVAAYPIGHWADHRSKVRVLLGGYFLGVATNALLAVWSGQVAGVLAALLLSGIYLAVQEVVEKASAAQLLPRELRSLGLGILACANSVGDMGSSLTVGLLLERGRADLAFGIPVMAGLLGVLWLWAMVGKLDPRQPVP